MLWSSMLLSGRSSLGGIPIRGAIDDKAESKIIHLLHIGGELRFATDYANCATPLDRKGQALFALSDSDCGALRREKTSGGSMRMPAFGG